MALSQSGLLEAKSENGVLKNQPLAQVNFPVFGDVRQSRKSRVSSETFNLLSVPVNMKLVFPLLSPAVHNSVCISSPQADLRGKVLTQHDNVHATQMARLEHLDRLLDVLSRC
jgi:hypothetical protein